MSDNKKRPFKVSPIPTKEDKAVMAAMVETAAQFIPGYCQVDDSKRTEDMDPVEAAYERMVEATAEWLSAKQWAECKGNPEHIGPTSQYHETWVHNELMSGDGMQFASAVSEQVQRQLSHLVEVEHNAQQYLKFFIVKRITQEQDAAKNSFSDVDFYAGYLSSLRNNPHDTIYGFSEQDFCYQVATRMAEIWEVEYKGQI